MKITIPVANSFAFRVAVDAINGINKNNVDIEIRLEPVIGYAGCEIAFINLLNEIRDIYLPMSGTLEAGEIIEEFLKYTDAVQEQVDELDEFYKDQTIKDFIANEL